MNELFTTMFRIVLFAVFCGAGCTTRLPPAMPTVHSFQILLKTGFSASDAKSEFEQMKQALLSKGFSPHEGDDSFLGWSPPTTSQVIERITYVQQLKGGKIYFVIANFEHGGLSADAFFLPDVYGSDRELNDRKALEALDSASDALKSISN